MAAPRVASPGAAAAGPAAGFSRAIPLCAFLLAAAALPAETFNFSGQAMSSVLAAGSERSLLKGNAVVNTSDMRITADEIELFGKDFVYLQCRGNVRLVDAKRGLDLRSRELFYDRTEKIARVKGSSVMEDKKNEMVVKGGFMEDRDAEKLTIIQIGVRILKKDLVCRAEFAKYWREKKILELSGMPFVLRKGDEYRAARITINLDTEEITLEGEVQGSIQEEEKKPTDGSAGGDGGGQ